MQPSLILWDWDNTLVDTFEAIFTAQNVMRAFYGMPPWTKEQSKQAMNTSGQTLIQDLVGPQKAVEAQRIFLKAYADFASHIQLKPGAFEILTYTHEKGFINVLASNKVSDLLQNEARLLNVTSFFQRIIGAEEAFQDKPSHFFTDKAIEGFTFKRLICIGDGYSDMKMAENYSDAIGILVGTNPADTEFQSVSVDYACSTLYELTNILEGLK